MAYDGLDLVFRLASDQIRWRPREVGAMRGRFAIRDQYGRVEYVMDGPGWWQLELIGDR